MLLLHINRFTRPGVPPHTRFSLLDRKRTEPTQFNPIAPRHGIGDLVEYRVHDPLYIPLVQVRIIVCNLLDEFRTNHGVGSPSGLFL
tara:strand:- start:508 stop:768 length:261 start_codon:yes stop_codon:yes gene_type:complete